MRKLMYFLLFSLLACFVACNTDDKKVQKKATVDNTIEILQKSVKEYPDSLLLSHDLIEAYRNQGAYDSALAITEWLIMRDSGNAYLWNIKATLFFETGDTTQATESLIRAIEIYPMPEYLVALGTIFATTKNADALLIANELLEFNKSKFGDDAYFIKGLYYNYIQKPKKAISYLDSCLRLDYTYMYAYREKGIALYQLGKYEDAIAILKRAILLNNNFEEGYYWLGRSYEKLDKIEDAMQSYQSALMYDKDYIEAKEALERLKQSRL